MKKFIKGTLLLTIGGFICKFIGAFFRIPLANILGATGMGYYQMVFPIYSFALVFVSGGIPATLSRFVSQSRANGDYGKVKKYFFYAIKISLLIGIFFAIIFLIFAKRISLLQGVENVYRGYYIIALTIIFSSILCAFRGLFQGFENMLPTFFSQIFEQIFKMIFGILFAVLLVGYGAEYGFLGALIGICLSEIISFIYLLIYTFMFNKKTKFFSHLYSTCVIEKNKFLRFSVPITLTSLVLQLLAVVSSLLVVNLLTSNGLSNITSTAVYGIQSGMINSIISFPTVISTALATSLLPLLAYKIEKNEKKEAEESIKNCLKIVWILAFPCMVGLYVLAPNVLQIAFNNAIVDELFDVATNMMQISSLSILFICIVQISTVMLQAMKKQWQAFVSLMLLFVSNIFFLILFIKTNGVYGMSLASLLSYSISSLLNLVLISKFCNIKMRFFDLSIPILSSIIMGIICSQLKVLLKNFNVYISTIFIVFIGILIYFLPVFLFKVLSFKNLIFGLKEKQKN